MKESEGGVVRFTGFVNYILKWQNISYMALSASRFQAPAWINSLMGSKGGISKKKKNEKNLDDLENNFVI